MWPVPGSYLITGDDWRIEGGELQLCLLGSLLPSLQPWGHYPPKAFLLSNKMVTERIAWTTLEETNDQLYVKMSTVAHFACLLASAAPAVPSHYGSHTTKTFPVESTGQECENQMKRAHRKLREHSVNAFPHQDSQGTFDIRALWRLRLAQRYIILVYQSPWN